MGRIIAVSYSALDVFERPPHRLPGIENRPAIDNYCYCGFRDHKGAPRPRILFEGLAEDLATINRLGLRDEWNTMLEQTRLLENEPSLVKALEAGDEVFVKRAKNLGSGLKTALSILTRLLASLRNGAMVLFDEPELNLHPSLLASVLRVVHDWLHRFDAYGIVATHSPIVLQEIPGKMVRVLDRVGRVPFLKTYSSEPFGQGLSEIVSDVFGIDERDKNYASVLRELLEGGMSAEQIEQAFGRPLSLNARMALRHLEKFGGSSDKPQTDT